MLIIGSLLYSEEDQVVCKELLGQVLGCGTVDGYINILEGKNICGMANSPLYAEI